jgi:hypothetical protein
VGFTNKVIFWIIPLIVLVVLVVAFFAEDSLFEDIKIATEDIQKLPYIPEVDVGVGAEIQGDEAPTIQRAQMEAIGELNKTIFKMKGQQKCFANYKGLPDLSDISVVFEEGVNKYRMIIKAGEHGTKEVKVYDMGNIRPCVIADRTASGLEITEMFFLNFLRVPPQQGGDFFKPVTSINLAYDGENKIFHDFGSNDIEDSGWLFTPDGTHMCFFPTNDVTLRDEDGTSKIYFKEALPLLVQNPDSGAKLCENE